MEESEAYHVTDDGRAYTLETTTISGKKFARIAADYGYNDIEQVRMPPEVLDKLAAAWLRMRNIKP